MAYPLAVKNKNKNSFNTFSEKLSLDKYFFVRMFSRHCVKFSVGRVSFGLV